MQPFAEWFIQLADIVSGWSVLAATAIATIGLFRWRSELVGKTKHDLARAYLQAILKYGFEFKRAQAARVIPEEYISELHSPVEPGEMQWIVQQRHSYIGRLARLKISLENLIDASYEVQVVLGVDTTKQLRKLEDCHLLFARACQIYFNDLATTAMQPDYGLKLSEQERDNARKVVYGNTGNSVTTALEQTVDKMSDMLRKHIR